MDRFREAEFFPSSCPGYDDSLWMMYQDQDVANTLLDDAGFKDVDGDGKREMPDGSKFTYKVAAQYSEKQYGTVQPYR